MTQTNDKMQYLGFRRGSRNSYHKDLPDGFSIHVNQLDTGNWRASLWRYSTLQEQSAFVAGSPDAAAEDAMERYQWN